MSGPKRTEMTIAVIGLIGVLATAVLSNFDKLFLGKEEFVASYSGYSPTNDFATEFRYYFDVSGARKTTETALRAVLNDIGNRYKSEYPENAGRIDTLMDAFRGEVPDFVDRLIRESIPIYERYFSVEDLHQLNKFYSTAPMQSLVKKTPFIVEDETRLGAQLGAELADRVNFKLQSSY